MRMMIYILVIICQIGNVIMMHYITSDKINAELKKPVHIIAVIMESVALVLLIYLFITRLGG